MRMRARAVNWNDCPAAIATTLPREQAFLTVGNEYEAHAISVTNGIAYAHVVNDSGWPSWRPLWFFDVVDPAIPGDWIARIDHGSVQLVLGPDFVARDEEALASISTLDSDQVARFWARVRARDDDAE